MVERWRERLETDGELTIRRSRGPTFAFLLVGLLVVSAGIFLAGVGGFIGGVGRVLTAFGLLAIFFLGVQAAAPAVVIRIDREGITPPGRPKVSWRELAGVELREDEGQLLALRVKPGYTKRTAGELGRVARWGREADRRQLGDHRIRLRTATPGQAEQIAELLRWARRGGW